MRSVTLVLVALAAAGCDGAGARSAPEDAAVTEVAELAGMMVVERDGGRWTAETPAGLEVELSPSPSKPGVGPMRFDITVPSTAAPDAAPTVDLVSPSMPMHGVLRYPAVALEPGRYVAEVEIPMGGLWALYVNLDNGGESAEFVFDVPESGGHQHGGGMADDGDGAGEHHHAGQDAHDAGQDAHDAGQDAHDAGQDAHDNAEADPATAGHMH